MNIKSKSLTGKVHSPKPERVGISEIDTAIEKMWSKFNTDIGKGRTVMRACMSNLVIYCDNLEEAEEVGNEIAYIVEAHPARVLLLIGGVQPNAGNLEALVGIYYTALNDGWQVCAERIDVIASSIAIARLPSIARAQLIGDLPVTFWWASRQPPPEAGELFFQLTRLANQVIYDNMGWPNPVKGVTAMTRWVAGQQDALIVHNLAWRRTATWRKLLSQVFDPQSEPGALENLNYIEVHHGPHALAMTWLLVGWLASRLEWKSVDGKAMSESDLVWQFQSQTQNIKIIVKRLPEGQPLIYHFLFDCSTAARPYKICFERLDNERIGIVENLSTVPARAFSAHVPARSALVAAQLGQRSRDKIFEHALKASNAMAGSFQQESMHHPVIPH